MIKLDLMVIALPYEHISWLLSWSPGLTQAQFWTSLSWLPDRLSLGGAFKGPGAVLWPSLASHSDSEHLGGCPNFPLGARAEPGPYLLPVCFSISLQGHYRLSPNLFLS